MGELQELEALRKSLANPAVVAPSEQAELEELKKLIAPLIPAAREAVKRPPVTGLVPFVPRLSTMIGETVQEVSGAVKRIMDTSREVAGTGVSIAREVNPKDIAVLGEAFTGAAPGMARKAILGAGQKAAIAADKLGIALPRIISSDKPFTRSVGNLLAKAPLIGDKIVLKTEQALRDFDDIMDNLKTTLGGRSAEEAGSVAKRSLDDAITASTGRGGAVSLKYKLVEKLVSNKRLEPLAATFRASQKVLRQRRASAATGPGEAITELGDALTRRGGMTFLGLQQMRTRFLKLPRDGEVKQLIKAIDIDMRNAIRRGAKPKKGRTAIRLFNEATRFAEKTHKTNVRLRKVMNLGSGEEIIEKIVRIANGQRGSDIALLRKIKGAVPDKKVWRSIISGTIEGLGRDSAGEWSLAVLGRNLGRMPKESKKLLFPDKAHREIITNLALLATRQVNFKKIVGQDNISLTVIGVLGLGSRFDAAGRVIGSAGGRGIIHMLANPPSAKALKNFTTAIQLMNSRPTTKAASALTRTLLILNSSLKEPEERKQPLPGPDFT